MVRLREIQRTAAFAWSPGATKPLIVTGTRAGAVDADFSDDTKLELWDLVLDDFEHSVELQPVASIVSDSRFYDIAWSQPDDTRPNGIIACALENGSLDLYDAAKLIAGSSAGEALISRTTKHSGAIKSLQFNPIKPHYLATAGAKGELFVYDVNDISSPFRLGAATARPDDLECVAWNRKVSHILASGSAGGLVTVWDLKTKKTSVTLNNNRKPVSAIEWDPNYSTKLITSSFDDTTPVIYLWDLRNTNTPERTMQGHVQGVLSLSWCPQDPDLLLSCGKDSRTLLWNPQNGELFGEFQEGTNWNFSTKFNPHNPSLTATASFDGKIVIQTLQNTNPPTQETANQSGLDGEDFFASAQTQPQETNFTLTKAPRWLERPIGASFGFGGKLVVFKPTASDSRSSKILITQFSADTGISDATDKFESSLSSGNIISICESKEEAASEDEKADWTIMKNLAGDDVRDRIVEFLGFTKDDIPKNPEAEAEAESDKAGATTEKKKDSDDDFFGGDDGEVDEDDFMASLSASKGAKTNDPFNLFNESESIMEQDVTRSLVLGNFEKAVELCISEKRWADAFLIANCSGAALAQKVQAQYLAEQEGKPSYIRLLNSVIAKNLWDVVHNADLDDWKQTMVVLCTYSSPEDFPDLCDALGDRMLESGERKDAAFCYLVGSKLEKVVDIWIAEMEEAREADLKNSDGDNSFSIHARSLQAFIEKVSVFRAVTNFQDSEKDQDKNWKLTSLYDKYTEYADLIAEQGKLATAQKYLDLLPAIYPPADIARERVKLATSPSSKKTTTSANTAAANRRALPVRQTATPTGYQPISQPQAPSLASARPPAPSANPYAPTGPNIISSGAAPTQPTNPYGAAPSAATASAIAPSASPYAPPANAYGSTSSAPQYGGYTPAAAAPIYGAPPQNFSAPPRNTPPPASIAPPSRSKNMMVWNDVPMVTKAPTRRATPTSKPAPITSPFPGGPSPTGPPPSSPGAGLLELSSTPPPPPKGPPMGRVTSPLAGPPGVGAQQGPPRSSSIAANTYAPPPATSSNPLSPPMAVPRMSSPYNAPPAAAPPSNRYAPAPASTAQANQPPLAGMMAPPPQAGAHPPPPANPYGPSSAISPTSYPPSGYQASAPPMAGPPMAGPPMSGPPMGGPPRAGPPMSGPPRAGPPMGTPPVAAPPQATPPSQGPPPSTTMSPPPAAGAPPQPTGKTYSGDRSNIPANAQRMVEIFTRDMKRVAASAPATYSAQVKDSQKRINILFDCLNKGELVKPDTIEQLAALAEALDVRDYATAQKIQADIQTNKPDECGKWIVGVKRLLSMSKATP